ncbi:hypothetical protein J2X07_002044 [Fictibacillus barbaricus]|uniref:YokE-like PH domain-containing protein n=1 Tax=Fictibacillus barbaricus TaxID=182136 RepID=A0ABU1U0R2_9BACL|nr:hypothetical protein [Fictibacillus barbaricus]
MEFLLLDNEKHILKDLVGKKLSLIYSHTLHYRLNDNTFSIHGTVILRTDDSFIMFESMELDCEENGYYDYYHTVSIKKSQFRNLFLTVKRSMGQSYLLNRFQAWRSFRK